MQIMISESYTINNVVYARVSKQDAMKLHHQGEIIYIISSKRNPISPWGGDQFVQIKPGIHDFNAMSDAYQIHFCNEYAGKTVKYFFRYKQAKR